MTDGPWSEGWPKYVGHGLTVDSLETFPPMQVIPLSDAERLRRALVEIRAQYSDTPNVVKLADAALNPERGEDG